MIVDGLQYCRWSRSIFEDMRAGGVGAVHVTVSYWESARETLTRIGEWHRRLEEHADLIAPATTGAEVRAVAGSGRTAILFGFQHCAPIEEEIDLLGIWAGLGVRFMQLGYNNQSACCGGCFEEEDPGLSRFGREVVEEMNRLGIVVDMSHSGERSTLEAIERSRRPVAVTHACPRAFRDTPRNKSETVLRALAETGGMFGFSLYPHHLPEGPDTTLEDFCVMVARTAEITGTHCLGIGSDLCQDQPDEVVRWMREGRWTRRHDPSVRFPPQPSWFRSNRDFANLARGLERVGFSADEVDAIMGGNWLRFFDESFQPVRAVA